LGDGRSPRRVAWAGWRPDRAGQGRPGHLAM